MKKLLHFATLTSFAWNLCLVLGVVFDASFSLTRAAGGQFEYFPISIRIFYTITTSLIIYQIHTYQKLVKNQVIKPTWLPMAFFVIGIVSVIANSLSRSTDERWNAIPAAIIAFAFWLRREKQEAVRKT